MIIFRIFLVVIFFGSIDLTSIRGKFNYWNQENLEEIDQIEVVQFFDTCTEYPLVKFLSKTLKKSVLGFINKLGDLITEPQTSVVCDRNIKVDNYEGFTIQREMNRAKVIFPKIENKIAEELVEEIFNKKYFNKPMGEIIKDFYMFGITAIIIIIFIFLICKYSQFLKKYIFKCFFCCTPHWLSKLIKNFQNNKKIEEMELQDNIDEIIVDKTFLAVLPKKKEPKTITIDKEKYKSYLDEKGLKSFYVQKNEKNQTDLLTDDEDSIDFLTHSSYMTPPQNPSAPPIQRQLLQTPYPLYPTLYPMPIQQQQLIQHSTPQFNPNQQTKSLLVPTFDHQHHSQLFSILPQQQHIQPSQPNQLIIPQLPQSQLHSIFPQQQQIQPAQPTQQIIPQLQQTQQHSILPQQHSILSQQHSILPQQHSILPQQHSILPQQQQIQPAQPTQQSQQHSILPQQQQIQPAQPTQQSPQQNNFPDQPQQELFSPIRVIPHARSPCPICPPEAQKRFEGEKGIKAHCRTQHRNYLLVLRDNIWGYIFNGNQQ
jgi:hypothetical protein